MKQFAVFGYDQYYPFGGMRDFKESFDTHEEAEEFSKTLEDDHIRIEDMNCY